MAEFMKVTSDLEAAALLRRHGIHSTLQRIVIARALFARPTHLSAEEVFQTANRAGNCLSKATIYNTLRLFATRGLIREVKAEPKRVFYDSNTAPHHHFYEETSGQLVDIGFDDIVVTGIPSLPEGAQVQGIDVVIRLKRKN